MVKCYKSKQIILLFFSLISPIFLFAQGGPGGVGHTNGGSELEVWMKADVLKLLNDEAVDSWPDASGNGNQFSQSNPTYQPVFKADRLNGMPVLEFDGVDDFLQDLTASIDARTVFVVYNMRSDLQGDGDLAQLWGSYDDEIHVALEGRASNPNGFSFDGVTSSKTEARFGLNGVDYTASFFENTNTIEWTTDNYTLIAAEYDANYPLTAQYISSLAPSYTSEEHNFGGEIAEIIVYNRQLNEVERQMVEVYLAQKYGLSLDGAAEALLTQSSYYSTFAGIGQISGDIQTSAQSDILRISNASDLNANEFLLFGHNKEDVSAWSVEEVQDSNIERIDREWRLMETGDVGEVTFSIHEDSLPALTAGYRYVLLADADGDFSTGSIAIEMPENGSSGWFEATIPLDSYEYVTVAQIRPVLQFQSGTTNASEISNASLTAALNYTTSTDISFDWETQDLTATGATGPLDPAANNEDYEQVSATSATIPAGSSAVTLTIAVNNDTHLETDESFRVLLSNPSAGINLEGNTQVIHTINDDDSPRKIYFSLASSSGDEKSNGQLTVQMTPSQVDNANSTTVNFEVVAANSTAKSGVDHTLTSGSLVIPPNFVSQTITLPVLDDNLSETDETVLVRLTSVSNASLSTVEPTEHTYTILDDDASPAIQFAQSTAQGTEDVTSVEVMLNLNTLSPEDVTVDFTLSGSASGSGVDFTVSTGTLTIPSGELSGGISLAILNDAIPETDETIVLTLSNPVNATIGAIAGYTYTIEDNDGDFGKDGPGGIGDLNTISMWLKADDLSALSSGTSVAQWDDASGNGRHASQATASYQPTYYTSGSNGQPYVQFDGDDDYTEDDYSYSGQTVFAVYRVNSALQRNGKMGQLWGNYDEDVHIGLDPRGTNLNGFSFDGGGTSSARYALNAADYTGFVANDNTQAWSFDAFQFVSVEFEQSKALTKQVIGSLVPGYAIGAQQFGGDIAELVVYNTVLNTTQRKLVENYLSAKYNLAMSQNDLFDEASVYFNDLAGIGQDDASNFYKEARSALMLEVSNPNALEDSEYLLFAHNGGAADSWSDITVSGAFLRKLNRTWKVQQTGDVGTVDIAFETASLPALPDGFTGYSLLVDDDGDFDNGNTTVYSLNQNGTTYTLDGVDLPANAYVSLGVSGPLVDFAQATSAGDESAGVFNIQVQLGQALSSDLAIDFSVSGIATNGVDYTATSSPLTIKAGNTTADISLTIADDSEVEATESVILNLISTGAGTQLGNLTSHTFQLIDNDNSGYTGPAGVGDALNNSLWLKADALPLVSDGTAISSWADASGNTSDFGQGNASEQPTYYATAVNGKPALRFDGTDDFMTGPSVASGAAGKTVFIVAEMAQRNGTYDGLIFQLNYPKSNATGAEFSITPEMGVRVSGNRIFNESMAVGQPHMLTVRHATGVNVTALEMFLDATAGTERSNSSATLNTGSNGSSIGWSDHIADFFNGDIAEIIVYKQELNDAQRIIIENYLAAKYGLDISASGNDIYTYDATHPEEVAGIGMASASALHTMAQSSDLLRIGNASDLDAGEYLLIGHNGGAINWNAIEVPSSNVQRIGREWRVAKTGDVGTVTLSVQQSALPALPANYSDYVIWVDNDGDFSNGGTTAYPLQNDGDGYYSAGNVSLMQGDHVTIGIIQPLIQFAEASSSIDEEAGTANISVILNQALGQDVTVDYAVDAGSTASGSGVDFTLADGTLTIPAGQIAVDLSVPIVSDMELENSETVILNLSVPSLGSLGSETSHTLTIVDNDNSQKIYFTESAVTVDEDAEVVYLTVRLNAVNFSQSTQVNYTVSGGTATNADFTLSEGTLTIASGEIAKTIPVAITDDLLDEYDETIEITLREPINANLGELISNTVTIADNDAAPAIEFTTSSSGGLEGTAALLRVQLSAVSVKDVSVDFQHNGNGSATNATDYILNGTSTLVIPAGATSGNLLIPVIDDAELEVPETFEVELLNPVNATLGTNKTLTYTINDNDNFGFEGPGGVGDASTNALWFSASNITSVADGGKIAQWSDLSGNENHAFGLEGDANRYPAYVKNEINGLPVVRFEAMNEQYLGNTSPALSISGDGEATAFMVVRNTDTDNESQSGLYIGPDDGGSGQVRHYGVERNAAVRFNNGNRIFDDGYAVDTWAMGMYLNETGDEYAEYKFFLNGTERGDEPSYVPYNTTPNTQADEFYLGAGKSGTTTFNSSRFLDGDVAEVILYNASLNTTQRIIVENYLAAKFAPAVATASDYFQYEVAHAHDLAGIGRTSATDLHTAAQSAGVLKVSNAMDLGDGEFLMFAHNGNSAANWVTTEVPSTNAQRLAREWRVDETGDVGFTTVGFKADQLPAAPLDYDQYMLWIDADGDFSSGATLYNLTLTDGYWQATDVDLSKGDYLALGVYQLKIDFELAAANGLEEVSPVTVNVQTNIPVAEAVTIDYNQTGGTATKGASADYELTNGTLTLPAGAVSASFDLSISDDTELETDETIEVTLSNPSVGQVGTNATFTYTINDNDNYRKVSFANAAYSATEGAGPYNILVNLTDIHTSDITVNFEVSSTQAQAGADYILSSGGLTIPAGETTANIPLQIIDDASDEEDETIQVKLTGGTDISLASPDTFIYTIQDDDASPEIQFTATQFSGAESFQTVKIPVALTEASGKTVTVDYTMSGVSATDGVDFAAQTGTLTFAPGSLTDSISFTVVDDMDEESTEQIQLALSNEQNASLGAIDQTQYYILDDDGLGWEGPGGVANLNTQGKVWLRSNAGITVNDGDLLDVWTDQTENGNDASQVIAEERPTFYNSGANLWKEQPVVLFSPVEQSSLLIPDTEDINIGGPYDKKTILVAFRTSSDVTNRQMLYEEGGNVRGLSIYLDNGQIYLAGWNNNDDDSGATTPWPVNPADNVSFVSTSVQPNTPYFAMLQFNFDGDVSDGFVGDVTGYINGDLIGVLPGAGRLFTHPGDIGIGGVQNGTVFHDGAYSGTGDHFFEGVIAEVVVNNLVFNDAQKAIVNNYFGAKYDIPLTQDLFAYETTHYGDVLGIGSVDVLNSHAKAKGSGIITIENPTSMGTGDYLFVGHDRGNMTAWTANEVSAGEANTLRVAREWRADLTGDVGTIKLSVETDQLPQGAELFDYPTYAILIDDDGDFSEGAEVFELTDEGSDLYSISDLDLSGDKYFTFGIIKQTVEFAEASSQGEEQISPVDLPVRLNAAALTDVTVNYKVTGGTANGAGTDYTLADGTLTIPAGQISSVISLDIIDDAVAESDETVIVSLFSPTGAELGTQTVHTYTIQDNDISRKVAFAAVSSAVAEDETTVSLTVNLSEVDNTQASTVDYEVTGGSASGNGVDYSLADGTLTIPLGLTSADIVLQLHEDLLNEVDETVSLQLLNPSANANLGTQQTYELTITNDDPLPEISFDYTEASGAESYSPVDLAVSLSAASGRDITLQYSVSGGTATNGGIDYTINNPSTLVIPAGSVTDSIRFSVFNDLILESDETIIVQLDNADYATIGADNELTYTVFDDDGLGHKGPGGVGDKEDLISWLKADDLLLSDNDLISSWTDASGNAMDAINSGAAPAYRSDVSEVINNRPVLSFNGSDQYLTMVNDNLINTGGPYTKKSITVVFETGADVTSRQVLYEQGGSSRGLAIYLEGGNIIASAYNDQNDDENSPWDYEAVSTTVSPNTLYMITLELAFEDAANNWLAIYENGQEVARSTGNIGPLFSHSGDVGIGGMKNGNRFAAGAGSSGDDYYFGGKMMELFMSNEVLTSVNRKLIANYLASKYGFTIADDYYAYDATHSYEVFGIGRDATSSHIDAQGSGIIRFDNPTSLGVGEYLLAGHDNADMTSWTTTESPDQLYIRRLAREWRVDKTLDVGNIQVGIDTASLPLKASDEGYALLISPDGDFSESAFANGTVRIEKMNNSFGSLVRASDIAFDDGDYFTVAVGRNTTIADGDWDNPDNWLIGVPDVSDNVVVKDGTVINLTADVEVSSLTLEDNATLSLNNFTLTISDGAFSLGAASTFNPGTGTIHLASASTQCIEALPGSENYYNLTLSGDALKTLCADLVVENDLVILGSTTLEATSDHSIAIQGDWQANNANFTSLNGQVIFNGSIDQHIQVTSGVEQFNSLIVNKAGGDLILNNDIQVSSSLDLTQGNIRLGVHNLRVDADASVLNGDATSYIEADGTGVVRKYFNDAASVGTALSVDFPIGDASDYTPFNFTLNSGTLTSANIDVNVTAAAHPNVESPDNYIGRYWSLEQNGITGTVNYEVRFIYTDTDPVGDEAAYQAAKYSASNWIYGGTVDVVNNQVSLTGLSTFSDFTAGEEPVVLPVTFTHFDAKLRDDIVLLEWTTETELNNDFFTIERSTDGVNFKELTKVEGKGYSSETVNYQWYDKNLVEGMLYYRLKQTDFDGSFEYNPEIISIQYFNDRIVSLKVYPNPVLADLSELTIVLQGLTNEEQIRLRVMSMLGHTYLDEQYKANEDGLVELKVEEVRQWPSGMYVLSIQTWEGVITHKFLMK